MPIKINLYININIVIERTIAINCLVVNLKILFLNLLINKYGTPNNIAISIAFAINIPKKTVAIEKKHVIIPIFIFPFFYFYIIISYFLLYHFLNFPINFN